MKLGKIFIWVCMVIFLVSTVSALGITPARKIVAYSNGQSVDMSFNIINDEMKDMDVVVYVKGDLSGYVSLRKNLVSFEQGEYQKRFSYTLNYPDVAPPPGTHEVIISVMELPKDTNMAGEETVIKGTVAVNQQLRIKVPYPGKYMEARLFVADAEIGQPVEFTMPLFNLGDEDLNSVKAKVKIYDSDFNLIQELDTRKVSIPAKEESKLNVIWTADVKPGTYLAEATIEYDGKEIKVEESFTIGSIYVGINGIEVGEFNLGDIAKFSIFVESAWNEKIPGVFAEMQITDLSGKELTKYRTVPLDLDPLGLGKFSAFWETQGIIAGRYVMNLKLFYEGKVTEQEVGLVVEKNKIEVDFQPTGMVVTEEVQASGSDYLIVVIVVLILSNVLWFVYFRNKKRKV